MARNIILSGELDYVEQHWVLSDLKGWRAALKPKRLICSKDPDRPQ